MPPTTPEGEIGHSQPDGTHPRALVNGSQNVTLILHDSVFITHKRVSLDGYDDLVAEEIGVT
jgi:hypothetical protein